MAHAAYDFPFGIMDVVALLGLRVKRRLTNIVSTDCPICGDKRGKMSVKASSDVFHCNYCDESGGMVALYAKAHGISNSDAYREICKALCNMDQPTLHPAKTVYAQNVSEDPAYPLVIHQTMSALLSLCKLESEHRKKLRLRGLSDMQIDECGFKSTPQQYLCKHYTEHIISQGCTVKGVPGFYLDSDGKWTIKLHNRTAGILIPVRSIDGLIRGAQMRLDIPIKDDNADKSKEGTKYLWLSSAGKHMGVSSGSPVHFTGNPYAKTVYVTEGALKGNVAHYLMSRTFACVAGVTNLRGLEPLFANLAKNGTRLIVEAFDMDKFSNKMVAKGAARACSMANSFGMETRRLTWNPNSKGVDDWQLSLKATIETVTCD